MAQIPDMPLDFPSPESIFSCMEEMRRICRDAWQGALLSGCNGNASQRLGDSGILCMTRSGAAKGRLQAADLCLVEASSGQVLANGPASSEAAVHLALYAARPECGAVLHSHPRHLLALSLVLQAQGEDSHALLRLPLYEAEVWRARLTFAPAIAPGSSELAAAVGEAASALPVSVGNPKGGAVWLAGHGLCCFAPSLGEALTMSEELEHLAAVQLIVEKGNVIMRV